MANLKSQGCTLSRQSTASPQVYAAVGQVVSIGGPSGTTGEIDVTSLSSTAKEFIPSLPDWGSVDCEIIFDQATTANLHQELWDDFSAQTVGSYKITLTDSPQTTFTFSAFVSQFALSIAIDDKVGASVSLRITSSVTMA